MTDRELLERAARAAGYTCYRTDERGWFQVKANPMHSWGLWNPLQDDADTLRLAVALRLEVHPSEGGCVVCHFPKDIRVLETSSDPAAATRRAIVRAAAALAQ